MISRIYITRLVSALLLGVGLTACAAPQTTRLLENRPSSGLVSHHQIDVDMISQEDKYCGPATLAMALNHLDLNLSQDEVAQMVYTPGREGTLQVDMINGARRMGMLATRIHGLENLLREIQADHPVVVLQNLSLDMVPMWHYALGVGYDLDQQVMILNSGLTANKHTSLHTFEHTWARSNFWALVISKPNDLPQTATMEDVVQAAVGLERAGHPRHAEMTYRTMLVKWPRSLEAALGLGNVLYAQDKFNESIKAYKSALRTHPNVAQLWNNLAYAHMAAGEPDQSLNAVGQAIRLGAENKNRYLESRRELMAKIPKNSGS